MKAATKNMTVDDVDQTMDDVRDQMDMAEELSNAISQPMGSALFDDDELEAELQALEGEIFVLFVFLPCRVFVLYAFLFCR